MCVRVCTRVCAGVRRRGAWRGDVEKGKGRESQADSALSTGSARVSIPQHRDQKLSVNQESEV